MSDYWEELEKMEEEREAQGYAEAQAYKQGRSDAIDEFRQKARNKLLMLECMEDAAEIVDEVAEQLKQKGNE